MAPFLKRASLLGLLLAGAPAWLRAGTDAAPAPAAPAPAAPAPAANDSLAPQPVLSSTLRLLGSYGLSPLRLRWDEVRAATALGLVAVALQQQDVWITARLATGDARKDWLDASMPTVSLLGEGWVDASAAALGWAFGSRNFSDTSVQALQAMAIAGVYNQSLKYVLWSNRPSQDLSRHRYFAYDQPTQGMPSGHSFSVFAAAEVYGDVYGRWWTYPFAALVAYSRLYNQAHWSSDVYVGAVLGVAAGWQVRRAAQTLGPPRWTLGPLPGREGSLALSHTF